MTNKEQLQALHVNSEEETSEEFRLYDLIDIGVKAGRRLFFSISYSITPANRFGGLNSPFILTSHKRQQHFLKFLHTCYFLLMIIPFLTEPILLSNCCLINVMKKGAHVAFILCIIAVHHCFENRGRRKVDGGLISLFRQAVILQEKFRALGIRLPGRKRIRLIAWCTMAVIFNFSIGRQYIFTAKHTPWYRHHEIIVGRALSLGMWTPLNSTISEDLHITMGVIGVLMEGLLSNFWYFSQIFSFFLVLTMWIIFDKINQAMKSGHLNGKQLPEVIDLHLHSTKLLNLMNEFISSLTFWSMSFNIVCMCFWTNYIFNDFRIRSYYIAALCFFLKTVIELLLQADVNSKAHQITEWLEQSCTSHTQNDAYPSIHPVKLAIFTAQVYSKESTGFKGLNFFVVTPSLVIAVVGVVVTYTVAVNQLCHTSRAMAIE